MARSTNKASEDALNIPQSTGAVEFDASPDEWGIPDDNSSTGAFPFDSGATVMTQGYIDSPTVVNYETPGPTTVMASFLSGAEQKVIDAQHASARGDVEVRGTEPAMAEEAAPEAELEPAADPVPEAPPAEVV